MPGSVATGTEDAAFRPLLQASSGEYNSTRSGMPHCTIVHVLVGVVIKGTNSAEDTCSECNILHCIHMHILKQQ